MSNETKGRKRPLLGCPLLFKWTKMEPASSSAARQETVEEWTGRPPSPGQLDEIAPQPAPREVPIHLARIGRRPPRTRLQKPASNSTWQACTEHISSGFEQVRSEVGLMGRQITGAHIADSSFLAQVIMSRSPIPA